MQQQPFSNQQTSLPVRESLQIATLSLPLTKNQERNRGYMQFFRISLGCEFFRYVFNQ